MINWNLRFEQQAEWTRSLRDFLYPQIEVPSALRILEIGCGTGAICRDLHHRSNAKIFGGDIDLQRLIQAHDLDRNDSFFTADAVHLPFSDESFDVTLCHYFLLWVKSPACALQEMARVTRQGGFVAALAEPDYGSRIDYPEELAKLGKLQTDSLVRQGANPQMGRMLPELFSNIGFDSIQFGTSGFQNILRSLPEGWESEWQVLDHDLRNTLSDEERESIKQKDQSAWLSGSRVLWVPTFYVFGRKVCIDSM